MKKVGIATFHYVDNYGAVLQAWALRKIINSFKNVNAEIVNYVPCGYKIHPYSFDEYGIIRMKEKRLKFEHFLEKECNIKTPIINSITGAGYDACCVGSDQVWNMSFRENITKEYLLPRLFSNVECFSYAASIGGRIKSEDYILFKNNLGKYKGVSVRETESIKDLSDIGIKNVIKTVDPTLLLDGCDYEQLIQEPERIPSNYLFFFSYPMSDFEKRKYSIYVNSLARQTGLKIVHSLPEIEEWLIKSDYETMAYEGVGEFLWYVKNASAIITTSFHGAIFGWLFKKPTYVLIRRAGDERLLNLVKTLSIEDYVIDSTWLNKKWKIEEYCIENKNLVIEKKESLNYLERLLI